MRKKVNLHIFAIFALLLVPLFARAQGNTCSDTTLTATGRVQIGGDYSRFNIGTFSYQLAGSPSSVSITIEAGNAKTGTPATEISAVTTTTNATTILMGTVQGPYRYYYANLGTFDVGAGKSLVLTSCFSPQSVGAIPGVAIGGAVLGAANLSTVGSVPFVSASGILSQDNSHFNYTASPSLLTLGGNIVIPSTTSSTVGSITQGAASFLHSYGTLSLFLGTGTGNFTFTGAGLNTGLGAYVLPALTTGTLNTGCGFDALGSNTTGDENTACGAYSQAANISGTGNTAFGAYALQHNLNHASTAFGKSALGANTSGQSNTACGYEALLLNTTGSYNTACGTYSLGNHPGGSYNTAYGNNTFLNTTSGNNNTALGYNAGTAINDGVTDNLTANNGLFLGYKAYPYISGGTNEIVIGPNAIGLGSNTMVLGNSSTTFARLFGSVVGIGATPTVYPLSVVAPNTTVASYFQGWNGGYAALSFSGDTGTTLGALSTLAGAIYIGSANYALGSQGGSSGEITIKSSNVGIGTASPAQKLDVNGSANVTGNIATGTLSVGQSAVDSGQVVTVVGSQNVKGTITAADPTILTTESLSEPAFATHAKWGVTGGWDAAFTGNTANWATTTGSLTQTQANLAVAGVGTSWYRFSYTISSLTASVAASITTSFALTAQGLNMTAPGTYTVDFLSAVTPTNFVITANGTGSFSLSAVSLKRITGGNIIAVGHVTIGSGSAHSNGIPCYLTDGTLGYYASPTDFATGTCHAN